MFNFPKKRSYQNLNQIAISQKALFNNHQNLQKFNKKVEICPVLKSNAYGHGLKEIAPIFDSMNCQFLVVDSLFEAYKLLKLKVKTPILIMGYTSPENFKVKKLNSHITIFDLDSAKILNKYQPNCSVHIFVDTGMNREGIKIEDLPAFISELKKLKNLKIVGLCSHFADADNANSLEFTRDQLKKYKEALKILEQQQIFPIWRHIGASSGFFKIKDDVLNMYRVGLASYGINPLEISDSYQNKIKLEPALEFSSTLVQIKNISKGEIVGYGCSFKAENDMTLGLLPAGYYDGVDRRLSNSGYVKIGKDFFPIIGRVSMNMTTIDISKLKNPKIGEKVIIYSAYSKDGNSLVNSALIARTISYDLLVHLAESVKRIVIR